MKTELVETKPMAESEVLAPLSQQPDELLRLAVKLKADVGTIERLMVVRRELLAEQAKGQFDVAMAMFKKQAPVIIKDKPVPDRSGRTAYKYSPLEAVEVQIAEHEFANGFYHTFPKIEARPGWVKAFCRISHRGGHSQDFDVEYPIGVKTALMSDTQQYASAETFAKRRSLCNSYGLVIAGEDLDGQTGRIKPQGPSSMQPTETTLREYAKQLWEVLKPVRGTKPNWNEANQWLWREEILDGAVPEKAPELSAKRFKEVIAKAKEIVCRSSTAK